MIDKFSTIYIDESYKGNMSILTAIKTQCPNELESGIRDVCEDIVSREDLQHLKALKNKESYIPHHCDDDTTLRQEILGAIKNLPFEAYVFYSNKTKIDNNFRWYNSLYLKLMKHLFLSNRHEDSSEEGVRSIIVEEHATESTRLKELRHINSILLKDLNSRGLPEIFPPEVQFGTKEVLPLSIADYICGAFRIYALKSMKDEASIYTRQYRLIKDKIRLVSNCDDNTFYSHTNSNLMSFSL